MRFTISQKGARQLFLSPNETIKCCSCGVDKSEKNYWYWCDDPHDTGLYCVECAHKPTILLTNPTFWCIDNFEVEKRG